LSKHCAASLQAKFETMTTPVLFVSHGSPTFAIDSGSSGPALTAWATAHAPAHSLKGVVVMSPHWMSTGIAVMTQPAPPTWHDFGGFPPALYALRYPAPGSPALAQDILDLLSMAGLPAQPDAQRPFDHGAWVPMMHLYPQANVPLVQISLPAHATPAQLYAVGQALSPLREQGVLLVGSGSMTHNLSDIRREGGPAAPHVLAFSAWIEAQLKAGDLQTLLDYRARAPESARVHPTDEHFVTIYFALGAARWGQHPPVPVHYITREVMLGTLSMDAFSL
jgi:4,5-DOPA dioxygenase extradiol